MLIQAQQTRFAFPEASVWKAAQDRWTDVIKKTPTTSLYANEIKKENIQPQFRKQIPADCEWQMLHQCQRGRLFLTCALKVKNQLWHWKVNKTQYILHRSNNPQIKVWMESVLGVIHWCCIPFRKMGRNRSRISRHINTIYYIYIKFRGK